MIDRNNYYLPDVISEASKMLENIENGNLDEAQQNLIHLKKAVSELEEVRDEQT